MKEILVDKNGNEIKNGDKVRIVIDRLDEWVIIFMMEYTM